MSTWAVLVAAGSGARFGGAKQLTIVGGRPLWQWSHDALLAGGIDAVVVVGEVDGGVPGGERRQDSVAAGLAAVPPDADLILVHDAARPVLKPELVGRVLSALGSALAVIPAVAVTDTLKVVDGGMVTATPDRASFSAVQTPQGFHAGVLRRAHAEVTETTTDDAAMVGLIGVPVATVEGDRANIKVTYPGDIAIVEALLEGADQRVGTGFDIHRFGGSPPVRLAGIEVDVDRGLQGTSDADAVAHAVADAILGAAALGDLGAHFPSSDERWHGADSMEILARVMTMAGEAGYRVGNVDVTVVVQDIRISPHAAAMVERLAAVLGVDPSQVSVKATTTDEVGWIGAGEGLAAQAVAIVKR